MGNPVYLISTNGARRVWPVSRGCLLLRGTWSYLRICRRSVLPYTRFCNCFLDYDYVWHIANFAILYYFRVVLNSTDDDIVSLDWNLSLTTPIWRWYCTYTENCKQNILLSFYKMWCTSIMMLEPISYEQLHFKVEYNARSHHFLLHHRNLIYRWLFGYPCKLFNLTFTREDPD
jgi:hypothetical protein